MPFCWPMIPIHSLMGHSWPMFYDYIPLRSLMCCCSRLPPHCSVLFYVPCPGLMILFDTPFYIPVHSPVRFRYGHSCSVYITILRVRYGWFSTTYHLFISTMPFYHHTYHLFLFVVLQCSLFLRCVRYVLICSSFLLLFCCPYIVHSDDRYHSFILMHLRRYYYRCSLGRSLPFLCSFYSMEVITTTTTDVHLMPDTIRYVGDHSQYLFCCCSTTPFCSSVTFSFTLISCHSTTTPPLPIWYVSFYWYVRYPVLFVATILPLFLPFHSYHYIDTTTHIFLDTIHYHYVTVLDTFWCYIVLPFHLLIHCSVHYLRCSFWLTCHFCSVTFWVHLPPLHSYWACLILFRYCILPFPFYLPPFGRISFHDAFYIYSKIPFMFWYRSTIYYIYHSYYRLFCCCCRSVLMHSLHSTWANWTPIPMGISYSISTTVHSDMHLMIHLFLLFYTIHFDVIQLFYFWWYFCSMFFHSHFIRPLLSFDSFDAFTFDCSIPCIHTYQILRPRYHSVMSHWYIPFIRDLLFATVHILLFHSPTTVLRAIPLFVIWWSIDSIHSIRWNILLMMTYGACSMIPCDSFVIIDSLFHSIRLMTIPGIRLMIGILSIPDTFCSLFDHSISTDTILVYHLPFIPCSMISILIPVVLRCSILPFI